MNIRGHLIRLAIFLAALNVPVDGFGKPPAPSLAEQVKKAELVVVGKLDPWDTRQLVPVKPGQKGPWAFRYAVVQIQVQEVLKGPAKLKTVPLRLNIGWVDGPVNESPPGIYQSGSDGVWLLTREEGQYVGPCLSFKQKEEIVGHLNAAGKQDPTPTTKPSASQAPDGRPIIRLPSSPPLAKAPGSASKAEKPDFTKPGAYKNGDWEYRYYTNGPAKRNPVVKGTLVFKGQEMGDPKDGSKSVLTPWGLMTWRGVGRSHGWSGWLLESDVPKPAEPPPKPDEETITQLIRQLNHDNFKVREKATKDLMAMGKAVHPQLKALLQLGDLDRETDSRIRIVLGEKPIPLGQVGQSVTDPASGVTVSITAEGKGLTATKGGKTIWQVRFQQPVAQTLKMENGLLIVSPDNSAYDLATGKCIWKNR